MNQTLNRVSAALDSCDLSNGHDTAAIPASREARLASPQMLLASVPTPSRQSQGAGRLVMLGLGLTTVVVMALAIRTWVGSALAAPPQIDSAALQQQDVELGRRLEQTAAYRTLLKTLGQDLAAGRCSLAGAVKQLQHSEALQATNMMPNLRQRLPGRSDAECLAATLMEAALQAEKGPVATEQLTVRLKAEFQATYHKPSPSFRWKTLDGRSAS